MGIEILIGPMCMCGVSLKEDIHVMYILVCSNSKTVTWLNFVACPVQCASILSILSTPVLVIHF